MTRESLQDPVEALFRWTESGVRGALAVVVKTYGSAPRPLGALMAVSETGQMVGSVSGGCVESAVVQEAMNALADGHARLKTFTISDEWAVDAGLTCGGNVDIFILPWEQGPIWRELLSARENRTPVVLGIGYAGRWQGELGLFYRDGRSVGPLASHPLALGDLLKQTFREESAKSGVVLPDGRTAVAFIPFFLPQRLIVVGAVHIGVALVRFANELDYETIVVDPRPVFASSERFGHADQLLVAWPQEGFPDIAPDPGTSIAVISHDDKIDLPALELALSSEARYIGALGSRKTMARRTVALRQAGFTDADLARIHNPIGLDLGGRSPEEIALATMAEIVANRYGKA
jgi:xanthine dehydrogenase accessory factor